jgi:hypothetical protein
VVVVPVDEHDVDVRVLQLPRRPDPGEASAEDEDARPPTGSRRVVCQVPSIPET